MMVTATGEGHWEGRELFFDSGGDRGFIII